MSGFDRAVAEAEVRGSLWMADDIAIAIVERWPLAPAAELKRLIAIGEETLATDFGLAAPDAKPHLTAAEAQLAGDALSAITFADGLEEAGSAETARRVRKIARALLDTLDALEAERSARVALQAARDQARAVLDRQLQEKGAACQG